MANRLKNILAFTNVGAGATASLPHNLNVFGISVTPDTVARDNGDFSIVSTTATTVTVRNDGSAVASCNVYVQRWPSWARVFGNRFTTELTPRPFVYGAGATPPAGIQLGLYKMSSDQSRDDNQPLTLLDTTIKALPGVTLAGGVFSFAEDMELYFKLFGVMEVSAGTGTSCRTEWRSDPLGAQGVLADANLGIFLPTNNGNRVNTTAFAAARVDATAALSIGAVVVAVTATNTALFLENRTWCEVWRLS